MGNLPEALATLQIVEEHAPKESPVHALLGQVYHRLGEHSLAIRHLNIAMDLDPKETASLRVRCGEYSCCCVVDVFILLCDVWWSV